MPNFAGDNISLKDILLNQIYISFYSLTIVTCLVIVDGVWIGE
jgi:hypothetical protein